MLPSKIGVGLKRSVILLLMVALVTACGSAKSGEGEVVAKYLLSEDAEELQNLTLSELDAFIGVNKLLNPMFAYYEQDPAFREEMLKQLVSFKIFAGRLDGDRRGEAEKTADEDYELFVEALEEGMGGKKEMDKQLKELGIDLKDLKSYILTYSLATTYLEGIGEEKAEQEFEEILSENPNAFTIGTVSHVLVGTVDPMTQETKRTDEEALQRAEEVREKLLGGADFAEMAKEYSDDQGSAENGGTYKDANLNQYVEEFKNAALTLPLHEISEPVKTVYGYHIIRVDERKNQEFSEVKDQIVSLVIQETFAQFLDEELSALLKEINLPQPETEDADNTNTEDTENRDDTDNSSAE